MSKIKVGDKAKTAAGLEVTVLYVGDQCAFVRFPHGSEGAYELDGLTKIEPRKIRAGDRLRCVLAGSRLYEGCEYLAIAVTDTGCVRVANEDDIINTYLPECFEVIE